MSNTPKRPLPIVLPIAQKLVDSLRPYCERIEIAGSIRRGRTEVGDIELVAIPKMERRLLVRTLFGEQHTNVNLLHEQLDILLKSEKIYQPPDSPAWGEKYRKFTLTSQKGGFFKIDLFMATPDNWGLIYLIRTGSAEFSEWAVTQAHKWGPLPPGYQVAGGQLWFNDQPIPCPEEQTYFDLLGIPFVEPQNRERKYEP